MSQPATRIFVYRGCETCRKALGFLNERGVAHVARPIRGQPPTKSEPALMLKLTGSMRRRFNTSGSDYKEMGLASRLPHLTESEALNLLARNGSLVKRPFLLLADGRGTPDFKAAACEELFGGEAQVTYVSKIS